MLVCKKLQVITFFIIISFITGCTGKQENISQKHLFDFNWKFHLGDVSFASSNNFNDGAWKNVDLPYDWSTDITLNQNNSKKFISWYRKEFDIPTIWKSKHISIYFEGINKNAKVFINGNFLSIDSKENNSLSYDLTKYINYQKTNNIAVEIKNTSQSNNISSQIGSGIYQHVWLIITDPTHFAP